MKSKVIALYLTKYFRNIENKTQKKSIIKSRVQNRKIPLNMSNNVEYTIIPIP